MRNFVSKPTCSWGSGIKREQKKKVLTKEVLALYSLMHEYFVRKTISNWFSLNHSTPLARIKQDNVKSWKVGHSAATCVQAYINCINHEAIAEISYCQSPSGLIRNSLPNTCDHHGVNHNNEFPVAERTIPRMSFRKNYKEPRQRKIHACWARNQKEIKIYICIEQNLFVCFQQSTARH